MLGCVVPGNAQETHNVTDTPIHASSKDCCAVIELRQYTLHRYKRDVLIDVFEREFVESQEAVGIHLIGTFRDLDDPNRFVWLRGFASMTARAEALQAFYAGPVWQSHRAVANPTMIDSDNVLLLKPETRVSGFAADDRALAPRDTTSIPPGLIELRLYYFDAMPSLSRFDGFAAMQPARAAAGASLIATLVSEPAVNTFPRLPVREGEWVIVLVTGFSDRESYPRFRKLLDAWPEWRRAEGRLLRDSPRSPDILRLEPTARSRLPR
jgi:hypothetical protein